MPSFSKIHHAGHNAAAMFDLVADVERYPDFLPLCEGLVVRSRRQKEDREILVTEMAVGYKNIHQKFTTQVVLDRPDLAIDVRYLDGPFRYLDNNWRFVPRGEDECDIHFDVRYEFKSRSLGLLMGAMFDRAFRRFTTAFEERADQLHV